MKRIAERTGIVVLTLVVFAASATIAFAQVPSATPTPDQRGLGIRGGQSKTDTQSEQKAREEVLQICQD